MYGEGGAPRETHADVLLAIVRRECRVVGVVGVPPGVPLLGAQRRRGPRWNFSPRTLLHRVVAPATYPTQVGYPVAEMRVRPRGVRRLLLVRGLR